MTDPSSLVADTYTRWADALACASTGSWTHSSLCEGWEVRHVVAHVTMPVRLTPAGYGAELAAAGGDFTVLSNAVAARDGDLPPSTLLEQLHAPALHEWRPPGGGTVGALSHAVIHSLDVTIPLGLPPVASREARAMVLDLLTAQAGAAFGLDLRGVRLEAPDLGWGHGAGRVVCADGDGMIALLSGRTLPDGRSLRPGRPA